MNLSGSESTLAIGEYSIPYSIVINERLTRIRIQLTVEDGVVVSTPSRIRADRVHAFVALHTEWILRHWKKIESQRLRFQSLTQPFLEKNSVTYLGRSFQLVVDVGPRHWPPVSVEDGVITVHCIRADLAEQILSRWFRQQARAVITAALELYRARMGVRYRALTIKDQKTRWGSCSRAGNLNFSWRLILAPREILDYVVIHELAHLREMNHSSRFWALVAEYCPDYKHAERWLKENGVGLRL